MGSYRLFVQRSAEREIERVPAGVRRLVVRRIETLANDPRPHGVKKLSAREEYRVRQGDYRVVFTIDDAAQVVTVVRVAHRSDVYR